MPARIPDADELGRAPKRAEYREHGSHFPTTITDRYGGWVEALGAAGLDADTRAMGRAYT